MPLDSTIFDVNGNLPSGDHPYTFDQFKEDFVDNFPTSVKRTEIICGFEEYCNCLKNLSDQQIFLVQWIDGSFTTSKQDPSDIDLATHIDSELYNQYIDDTSFKSEFEHYKIKSKFECDTYYIPIYPQNDMRYRLTQKSINYWSNWFGKDRIGNKKGIVSMNDHIIV